ncbi:hypothetical protein MKK58_06310 [Methylobacterium sp. J-078]|uniref:hypothetical protein n=1 Tax=Methylobacterium sp. J-078 TaxID=2836657 RepID=UPI001FB9452D|nr:hypothetical protein [Methylobacterium sp. J-078]MCJ2044144.1 hypothetical protein [Methylobacterium sp. J-078]
MTDPVLARARSAGVRDIEELIAEAPPAASGGNGGPSLEPSFATLERIGRAVFLDRWIGKLGEQINVHDKTIRRWGEGEGAVSERAMTKARTWALTTAQALLRAVGEDDLAADVGAVLRRHLAPDETTVAATWAETQARVNAKLAADAEEGRDGWAEIDAKAEARRAARAVRLAEKP